MLPRSHFSHFKCHEQLKLGGHISGKVHSVCLEEAVAGKITRVSPPTFTIQSMFRYTSLLFSLRLRTYATTYFLLSSYPPLVFNAHSTCKAIDTLLSQTIFR